MTPDPGSDYKHYYRHSDTHLVLSAHNQLIDYASAGTNPHTGDWLQDASVRHDDPGNSDDEVEACGVATGGGALLSVTLLPRRMNACGSVSPEVA